MPPPEVRLQNFYEFSVLETSPHAPPDQLQQRPNDYGIPVAVEVTYVQDNFLTSDVLNEMVRTLQHSPAVPLRAAPRVTQGSVVSTDAAGGILQSSSGPGPVQPVLVPRHHHDGQDQGRTRPGGLDTGLRGMTGALLHRDP